MLLAPTVSDRVSVMAAFMGRRRIRTVKGARFDFPEGIVGACHGRENRAWPLNDQRFAAAHRTEVDDVAFAPPPVIAPADELDEARRPVAAARRAAVRERRKQIADDDPVARAVDAVAALDLVG